MGAVTHYWHKWSAPTATTRDVGPWQPALYTAGDRERWASTPAVLLAGLGEDIAALIAAEDEVPPGYVRRPVLCEWDDDASIAFVPDDWGPPPTPTTLSRAQSHALTDARNRWVIHRWIVRCPSCRVMRTAANETEVAKLMSDWRRAHDCHHRLTVMAPL